MSRVMYGWRWSNGEWRDGPEPREQEQPATIEQKPRKRRTRTCFTQPPMPPRERKLRADNARLWLETALHAGPRPAAEIFTLARLEGVPVKGLKRAKRHLRIKSVKIGGGYRGWGAKWIWQFPAVS